MLAIFRYEPIDYSIRGSKDEEAIHLLELLYDAKDAGAERH
jgi:hypothetical protein